MDRKKLIETYQAFRKNGELKNSFDSVMMFRLSFDHVAHLNSTRVQNKDPLDINDIGRAETEAREQIFELYKFLKNNVSGMEECKLLQSASALGVRESRRIAGLYQLTADDILGTVKFEDSVARGVYCIDIHDPEGGGINVVHIPDDDGRRSDGKHGAGRRSRISARRSARHAQF